MIEAKCFDQKRSCSRFEPFSMTLRQPWTAGGRDERAAAAVVHACLAVPGLASRVLAVGNRTGLSRQARSAGGPVCGGGGGGGARGGSVGEDTAGRGGRRRVRGNGGG